MYLKSQIGYKNIKNVQVVFCRVKQTGKYRKKNVHWMLWGRLFMLEFVLQSYFGIGPSQGSYYAVFTSSSTTQQYAFLVAEAYLPGKLQKVSYHIISRKSTKCGVILSAVKDTPDVLCINTLWIISDCPFQN